MDVLNNCTFDDVVLNFQRSAASRQPWGAALECLRDALRARLVNLYGLIKSSRSVALSFEAGDIAPQAALDFIRRYHHIEPRALLLMNEPVGKVVSCHRHFNDAFVATDPFYQEFLIPSGLRYTTGIKAYEDDEKVVFCGVHRGVGSPPLNECEEALVRRLGPHLKMALQTFFTLQAQADPAHIGHEILSRLPYSTLLLDETRRIVFQNQSAQNLIERSSLVHAHHGLLCGPDAQGDAKLLLALRSLGLSDASYLGQTSAPVIDKAQVKLEAPSGHWLGVHLHTLRSADSMRAFGPNNLALAFIHTPDTFVDTDPFVVAAMWDLSPAEAQLVVGLGRGQTVASMAQQRGVALATIRSQLQTAMTKVGVSRQAELLARLTTFPPTLLEAND